MKNSKFLSNKAEDGVVILMNQFDIDNCTINNNIANDDGGGLYTDKSFLKLSDSIIEGICLLARWRSIS